jgi:hypothetical protein
MQTQPSLQYRLLGLAGAVEAGTALWRFTSGHWVSGTFCAFVVVVVAAAYVTGQRRLKGQDGGRRY